MHSIFLAAIVYTTSVINLEKASSALGFAPEPPPPAAAIIASYINIFQFSYK